MLLKPPRSPLSKFQIIVEPEHETYHGQNPTTKSQINKVVLPLHKVPTGDRAFVMDGRAKGDRFFLIKVKGRLACV